MACCARVLRAIFYVVCVSGAVSHAGSRAVPDDVNGVLARPPRQPIMSAAAVC